MTPAVPSGGRCDVNVLQGEASHRGASGPWPATCRATPNGEPLPCQRAAAGRRRARIWTEGPTASIGQLRRTAQPAGSAIVRIVFTDSDTIRSAEAEILNPGSLGLEPHPGEGLEVEVTPRAPMPPIQRAPWCAPAVWAMAGRAGPRRPAVPRHQRPGRTVVRSSDSCSQSHPAHFLPIRSLPMIWRMISFVPPKMRWTRASWYARATGYSVM